MSDRWFKSPKDSLTIDGFYKVIGYSFIYKGLSKEVNAVPINEITISIFRDSYPKELFSRLRSDGADIDEIASGIFDIKRIVPVPIHIIVVNKLDKDKYHSIKILKSNADESDIRCFIEKAIGLNSQGDIHNAQAVLEVSVSANKELYKKLEEVSDMGSAIDELLKDKLDEREQRGMEKERVSAIKSIMSGFKVTAEQAMQTLGIPKSDYNKYMNML